MQTYLTGEASQFFRVHIAPSVHTAQQLFNIIRCSRNSHPKLDALARLMGMRVYRAKLKGIRRWVITRADWGDPNHIPIVCCTLNDVSACLWAPKQKRDINDN